MIDKEAVIIPKHKWTHTGDKVLVVRQCAHDGSSSRGFMWPKSGLVTCPDWEPHNKCGNGLHGWPWGLALGDGTCQDYSYLWLVVAVDPSDVIDVESNGGKVKFKQGEVIFAGEWWKAMKITEEGRVAWINQAAKGQAATSGDSSSAATSGYSSSSATSGDSSSAATSGNSSSAATSGNSSSAATSGYRSSAATSGDSSSAASTGKASVAVCTGSGSRAKAGEYGVIALSWRNDNRGRAEMRCSRVVDGKRGTLKPNVWYRLNSRGRFVQEKEPKA